MKRNTPLVVGNWKMNPQTRTAASKLFKEVKKSINNARFTEIVAAPPFVYIQEIAKLRNGKKIGIGAQDIHHEKLGAFTGEVSLPMLSSLDVSYVIIGHSERREMGETDEEVNKKVAASLKADITTIVCVGEKKRDSHARYFSFVEKQIRRACAGVSRNKLSNLVIAYEPIWAIGTGDTATPHDAHEMRLFIQRILTDIYGRNSAMNVRILYGGSVNGKNAEELFVDGTVDGFLVGGASLRADDFGAIVSAVETHAKK